MRNLAQYPVTKKEILTALEHARNEELMYQATIEKTIGHTHLVALEAAIKTIESLSQDQIARVV